VPIVLGGEHATAVPELCLAEAPALLACAIGEGEETAVELVEALSHDRHRSLRDVAGIVFRTPEGPCRTTPRARIRDVDDIPPPRWDLTPIERYLDGGFSFGVDRGRTMPLLATRGCPYRCTFCSSPQMWTTRYSTRDPRLVVDEIEDYIGRYRATSFDFYDLTSIVKPDWITAFCAEIERRKLRITWSVGKTPTTAWGSRSPDRRRYPNHRNFLAPAGTVAPSGNTPPLDDLWRGGENDAD